MIKQAVHPVAQRHLLGMMFDKWRITRNDEDKGVMISEFDPDHIYHALIYYRCESYLAGKGYLNYETNWCYKNHSDAMEGGFDAFVVSEKAVINGFTPIIDTMYRNLRTIDLGKAYKKITAVYLKRLDYMAAMVKFQYFIHAGELVKERLLNNGDKSTISAGDLLKLRWKAFVVCNKKYNVHSCPQQFFRNEVKSVIKLQVQNQVEFEDSRLIARYLVELYAFRIHALILDKRIGDIRISATLLHKLMRANIYNLGGVVKMSRPKLARIVGTKGVDSIQRGLKKWRLRVGMNVEKYLFAYS